ncbi:MAG: glycosyl transferase, family 51 [Proteobacteria bacterium]|nr:glycosyl transferase, family 51 [Pseudomonadota bacterium]
MSRCFVCLIVLLLGLLAVAAATLWWLDREAENAWVFPVQPGGIRIKIPAMQAIRLATSDWGMAILNGYQAKTRYGTVKVSREDGRLRLRCSPCVFSAKVLGDTPLELPHLEVSIRRQGNRLSGEITANEIKATWHGELNKHGINIETNLPPVPLASVYGLFRQQIPELAYARIEGRLAMQGSLSLPDGRWHVEPQLDIGQVGGLGTEILRGVIPRPACSSVAAGDDNRWLKAAVIAAEDQKFLEHRGFDPVELAAAFKLNARQNRPVRGASTISQQVAKLLFSAGDRTPARKLRELLYAVEMERTLGKGQILQIYLGIVPWGESVCGSEAAAQYYFGKPAARLRPAEAAWLASLLRSPAMVQKDPERVMLHAEKILGWMKGMGRSQRQRAMAELRSESFQRTLYDRFRYKE